MTPSFYVFRRAALALLTGLGIASGAQAQSGSVTTQTQSFSYTGQIVTWLVPTGVTSLTIEARGAQGGSASYVKTVAGKGAILRGTFSVSSGQSLSLLVGGQGRAAGGGGGSFVVSGTSPTQPLLIAGGGGGAASSDFNGESGYDSPTKDGQVGPDGGAGAGPGNSGGQGGTSGDGGTGGGASSGTYANAGGGSGFQTDGLPAGYGGKAFVNGGNGGQGGSARSYAAGGFGGGGAGSDNPSSGNLYGGGGGGGYSGGGGGSVIVYQGTGVGGAGARSMRVPSPIVLRGRVMGTRATGSFSSAMCPLATLSASP